jgi:hypothetical protein
MSWLVETPWPAIWLGAIIVGLLAVALINTGRRSLVTAMAAVAGVVAVLVLIEWLVVTDRELVDATLENAARALERNDMSVLELIAPDAAEIRGRAELYLPQIQVSNANIGGDLQVTINRHTSPTTARATFTARISGKSRSPGQALPYDNYVRRVAIKLRKSNGKWLLTDFDDRGGP